jgi:uncharacterized low-complexity protein
MKKINMKKLTTVAASAAIVATFSAGSVNASENPFGMQELSAGYNVAMSEGTCGEGKCGEGKCGGDKAKEAKCGEGKCGGDKAKEAKCGEGKCGGDKAKEAKCGGEGKCGAAH